ncbi:MAG: family 78 glycoside hydrolase catalytic domain, partial [Bacteroidetes bacterium]|nr:family 78 glycoside hydrolase catalytic domain [Bacteroidota bacterium]
MSAHALVLLLVLAFSDALFTAHAGGTDNMNPTSSMHIVQIRCEGFAAPMGIDEIHPRFSWVLESDERGQAQTAYQILVSSRQGLLDKQDGDMWNSEKVLSDQSIQVAYRGKALESGKAYYWKVRAWDRNGRPSEWSASGIWTMGLLHVADWKGKWIGRDEVDKTFHLENTEWIWFPGGQPDQSAPVGKRYFRRSFDLPFDLRVESAVWHVTADDEGDFFVNGAQVCSTRSHRVLTEVDVKQHLRPGKNVLAVAVLNQSDQPNPAGLVGVLDIQFGNGSAISIPTDAWWKAADSVEPGWVAAELDESDWVLVQVLGRVGMPPWGEKKAPDVRRLPARWLRKEVAFHKPIRRATVYMSGLGLSELYINGRKIGDHVLSPALSEYPKRVYYVTHDVTRALAMGQNALGVVLGNGRYYAPRLGEPTMTQTYGYPKLLFQLRVEFEDGTAQDIVSDESWRLSTDGPIVANNEYDGEEYDATREFEGWAIAGFDDTRWDVPSVVAPPGGTVRAQMIAPIRVVDTLQPVSVAEPRPGVFIVDMGQNMVGWCRLRVNGTRGTRVVLRHAETLRPDGELYMDNLRGAKVTDVYTLKGGGEEVFEPRFTYHGFRFVEVTGYPGRLEHDAIAGRVVNDDVEHIGEFTCSHPVINRTYRSVVWGVRGNYRSIPTDCPQRDERQGWLGDRSAEARGESYMFDISALYAKWMQDIADAQQSNGSVSDVCPSYWPLYNDNVTWPSSTVIIPGTLLEQYADTALIRRHYPSMVLWIDHMTEYIEDDILEKDTYGDWCVPPESPELIHSKDPMRKTAPGILATAYFTYDVLLMSRYAALMGKDDDAQRFSELADRLKDGLNERFFDDAAGYYDNGSQTSCVLPLAFDMVPTHQRGRVFERLIRKITDESKGHVGTGLIGGQWLNRVLTDFGRPDIAYRFATNTTYPSWGYMMEKGATTVWELWNGDSADPAMNSGNHVMLVGDLVIWLYENLAGLKGDPGNPGFKHIVMQPTPVGDLS